MPLLISLLVALAVLPVLAQAPVRINPGETGTAKPVYRETKTGETRVEGLLRRVECPRGRPVTFTLRVKDKPERYDRVFLTWKATGTTRTVVAVEFLGK